MISVPTATTSVLGLVKTDGSTLTNSSGAIAVATATTSQLGASSPDGTTITVAAGVYSVATPSALVHLHTINAAAAASVAFSSTYLNSTYDNYLLLIDSFENSDATASLDLTFSTNNGTSYLSSNYGYTGVFTGFGSTTITNPSAGGAGASSIPLDLTKQWATTSSTGRHQYSIEIANPSASQMCSIKWGGTLPSNNGNGGGGQTGVGIVMGAAMNSGTTAVNNIKFTSSGGGNLTGNFHLYGVVN